MTDAMRILLGAVAVAWGATAFGRIEVASPESVGVPSEAIRAWVGELERTVDHPRDFIVVRHGRQIAAGHWRGVVREEGRTPVGGLTRLALLAGAGIAIDREQVRDDAEVEALLHRMMGDTPEGAAAADALSARIERDVGESTATFLASRLFERLDGGSCPYWTAAPQTADRRLMKGSDGMAIGVYDLARLLDVFLRDGASGPHLAISSRWMRDHAVRTVAFGGNFAVVSPERNAIVVVLSADRDAAAIRAATERVLLPAFAALALPENGAAARALADQCRNLALPPEKVEQEPPPAAPSFGSRHEVLLLPPHGNIHRNSEGDIIRLRDGRLMLMWSRMLGANSDDAHADICRRYSSDGGRTWTEDEVLFPPPKGSDNVMCVSLLRLTDGRIATTYLVKLKENDCRPVFRTSSDEGRTWSEAKFIIPDAQAGYYVANNARLIQLRHGPKAGRLLLSAAAHSGPLGNSITSWSSDDGGATWKVSPTLIRGFKPNGDQLRKEEPGQIELRDGTVVTYFRTDADWQYMSGSTDGGDTWETNAVPWTLRSPRSPATVERLSDGRLAVVWNDHETHPDYRFLFPYHNGGRQPQTLAFSRDEGRTWTDRVDLEMEGWNCYTFVREIDGRLFIGYCTGSGMRTLRVIAVPL